MPAYSAFNNKNRNNALSCENFYILSFLITKNWPGPFIQDKNDTFHMYTGVVRVCLSDACMLAVWEYPQYRVRVEPAKTKRIQARTRYSSSGRSIVSDSRPSSFNFCWLDPTTKLLNISGTSTLLMYVQTYNNKHIYISICVRSASERTGHNKLARMMTQRGYRG